MRQTRRLLSIGHSYVVGMNRRLTTAMQAESRGRWDVTVAAPAYFHGGNDLRPVTLRVEPGESVPVESLAAHLTRQVHLFWYGRRLRSLLRSGFDLVHAWEEPYIVAGGQIAWQTPRETKLVFRTAQSHLKRYPPPFNAIEAYAMGRAAGWICSGRTVADTLRRKSMYREKPMLLAPLGVDVERFKPSTDAGRAARTALGWADAGPPVVGFLGRLIRAKGVGVLMNALDRLSTPWRALIVGEGPMRPAINAWASRYGDRVRVCDKVGHDEVPSYLNAMDTLVAPSLTTPRWREQFGRMVVEAFASGVPVIGSDSGELPNVIGDAGIVTPEGDADALAAALADLLNDPHRRRHLAAAGLEQTHRHFTWPIIARQYLDFFDAIADG